MYINFYQYSGRFAHFPVLISTPVIFPSLRVSLKLINVQIFFFNLLMAFYSIKNTVVSSFLKFGPTVFNK